MRLLFVPTETTFGYFAATLPYLKRHGKPVAFYSDKAGIFRVHARGARASAPTRVGPRAVWNG
ncbi:hypothetical protein CUPL110328_00730 [Cupriavidus plantarum]|nr:hypothetical protein LMG26296_02914 [Cupriavidus plantarum]